MEELKFDKKTLRKFAVTMGIAFFIIAIVLLIRHKHSPLAVLAISFIWFALGMFIPGLLKPVYILWMRLAFILSWVNTRIILFIIFYLIFTPAGLVMRMLGTDPLKKKIDKNKDSYWQKADSKIFKKMSYERQY
jgi:hypothetical protein